MLLNKLSGCSAVVILGRTQLVTVCQRALFTCQNRGHVVLDSSCQTTHQYVSTHRTTATGISAGVLQQGSPLYNIQSTRFYMRKKTIKIPPTKPLSFDYSGDLDLQLAPIDPSAPKPGYEDVDNLKSAGKDIKAMFSMDFADGVQKKEKRLNELMVAIQEHPADIKSLEVKIARLTLFLRNQMRHVLKFRKDKVAKILLVRRIHYRNCKLRLLRTYDMEKFEWLLRELKIKYVPKRTLAEKKPVTKRAARKAAARQVFLDAKKQKLADLRARLETERVSFEREKEEELTRIVAELEAMGITEFNSVDSVLEAIGMDKYIEKPEKRMKRRYMILGKKFALHAEKEREKREEEEASRKLRYPSRF